MILTALDVFMVLFLQTLGFRYVEALIVTLLGVIFVCFGMQIAWRTRHWGAVIAGFAPTTDIVTNPDMLYLALGILGATVMPHTSTSTRRSCRRAATSGRRRASGARSAMPPSTARSR